MNSPGVLIPGRILLPSAGGSFSCMWAKATVADSSEARRVELESISYEPVVVVKFVK
jgi:hypothetical protein